MWKVVRIHNGRRPFALEHDDGRMLRTQIRRGVHVRSGAIRVWQDSPAAQREADKRNAEQVVTGGYDNAPTDPHHGGKIWTE
jgi:hypothetical protein